MLRAVIWLVPEGIVLDNRLVLPANAILDGGYRILGVVGLGGFGITYEAEDIGLGAMVAIKEYYPFDFADRDLNMSVRPASERHKQTFNQGRSDFLAEARTLASLEHPSIARVTRMFEANSTVYIVMRLEQGLSFESWLSIIGRPPTQEELDLIAFPLLEALEIMHGANVLHGDIAPDNIIVRGDGTPVLLDFGAARHSAPKAGPSQEGSCSLTGIVKTGYSPPEQYNPQGRFRGPWSDLYALGATLYCAITGKAPEEAMLRVNEEPMVSAQAVEGEYRSDFLAAIDACLKVRHSERPQSVPELRRMMFGPKSQPTTVAPRPALSPSLTRHSQENVRWLTHGWPAVGYARVLDALRRAV